MNLYKLKNRILIQNMLTKGKKSDQHIPLKNHNEIDFIVPWLDSTDPEWQRQKAAYSNEKINDNPERYRNWDNFQYFFRSVEKYAPWVRKVYFVTNGQKPEWLNTDYEKVVLVSHDEYMDQKYLPTFNSIPIEMNFHRIEGLSENFVLFNDDLFLGAATTPEDFFSNDLPRYCAAAIPLKNNRENGDFRHLLFSNLGLINGYFQGEISKGIKQNPEKWFSRVYDSRTIAENIRVFNDSYIYGMHFTHLAAPFRKKAFEEVWEALHDELDLKCTNKFRTPFEYNHQIISMWDMVKGNFYPVAKDHYGVVFDDFSHNLKGVRSAFESQKYITICLNDSNLVEAARFEETKTELIALLDEIFPVKSKFEK